MRHQFTLTLRLPPSSDDPMLWLDALAAAGCDDATIGLDAAGCLALCFTREGRSRFAAITLAVREVTRAIPGSQIESVAVA